MALKNVFYWGVALSALLGLWAAFGLNTGAGVLAGFLGLCATVFAWGICSLAVLARDLLRQ